jgi:lipoate-protein ligase B
MIKRNDPHKGLPREALYLELPGTGYEEAFDFQSFLVEARADGILDRDLFIFLEHNPVFTLGKRGGTEYITAPEEILKASGIPVVQTNRGGTITYHGPGQVIMYPIVALKKARLGVLQFVELLEEIMIRTASRFHVSSGRNPLNRGVWVGQKKLGSIGLAVHRGVTCHGLAFNVDMDLEPFSWINPCGLDGVKMTSLARELSTDIHVKDILPVMKENVESLFNVKLDGFIKSQKSKFFVISRRKYLSGDPVFQGSRNKPGPRSPTG